MDGEPITQEGKSSTIPKINDSVLESKFLTSDADDQNKTSSFQKNVRGATL